MQHRNTFLKLFRLVGDEIKLRRVTSGMNVSIVVAKFSCTTQLAINNCISFCLIIFFTTMLQDSLKTYTQVFFCCNNFTLVVLQCYLFGNLACNHVLWDQVYYKIKTAFISLHSLTKVIKMFRYSKVPSQLPPHHSTHNFTFGCCSVI